MGRTNSCEHVEITTKSKNNNKKMRQKFKLNFVIKSSFFLIWLTGHRQPSNFEELLQWSFTEISREHDTNPEIITFSVMFSLETSF
jgi:hypothetical protein